MRAGFLAAACVAAFATGVAAQTADPRGPRSSPAPGLSRTAVRALLDDY